MGFVWLYVEALPREADGRTRYRWTIDLHGKTRARSYAGSDLRSGCQGGTVQEGFASLLSFLGAASESFPDGENSGMFPRAVEAWAHQYSDELSMLACEVEENADAISAR